MKIVMDVALALIAIVLFAPLLLIIALLVSLDGGPIIFKHVRVGAGGRPFACFKFRSMVVDSADVLTHLLETDPVIAAEWSLTHKLQDDPRITKVGKFLRVTSLDEIPQLFNVLRMEMSLVGPRPITADEVGRYGDAIHYYYRARPGLTGLWQVSGRAGINYAERVRLDISYVRNWSLAQDCKIIALTIPAVLMREGAH